MATLVATWKHRNLMVFEGKQRVDQVLKNNIRKEIANALMLVTGICYNNDEDNIVSQRLGISLRLGRAPTIKTVIWLPPPPGMIKANTDGAARGCPGPGGVGISFRNSDAEILGVIVEGLGVCNNFWAEAYALVLALEEAIKCNWYSLWIESDSLATIQAFNSGKIP
ncbi:hypothetical protein ACHQM5_025034 [Ranunculus cassubicifolius]